MKTPIFTAFGRLAPRRSPAMSRKPTRLVTFAGLAASLLIFAAVLSLRADDTATNALSAADQAWKETSKLLQPPMPPPEWQMQQPTPEQIQQFREEKGKLAADAAEKAKDFYTKYPDHPKAAEARRKETDMLQIASQLGNTNVLPILEAREQEQLKDPKLTEDERFSLRFEGIRRSLMAKQTQGDQAAVIAAFEKSGNDLIKEFPKHAEGYQLLLEAASNSDGDKARSLAKEITSSDAPQEIKSQAEGLLRKMDALGKPLDIKFTAVDGRDVDMTKLKGKVVLVDFWATWCGPCVHEVPNVVAAYDKLHPKGFEIVGISFDRDEDKLKSFTADQKMSWVQFFDGKQWQNKYGQQFGINSIPTMWLVDKKGNLRDMNARGALEEKVDKLLAE